MCRGGPNFINLNPEKIQIKELEIKFFVVICSADGVRPDP